MTNVNMAPSSPSAPSNVVGFMVNLGSNAGGPCDFKVLYGTTPALGSTSDHWYSLMPDWLPCQGGYYGVDATLTSCSTYYYSIVGTNAEGSTTTAVAELDNIATWCYDLIPNPPVNVTATPGDSQAVVSFSDGPPLVGNFDPPNDTRRYCVSAIANTSVAAVCGSSSPITITGLRNGTTYTFTVVTVQGPGSNPSTPSNPVTPTAPTSVSTVGSTGTSVSGTPSASSPATTSTAASPPASTTATPTSSTGAYTASGSAPVPSAPKVGSPPALVVAKVSSVTSAALSLYVKVAHTATLAITLLDAKGHVLLHWTRSVTTKTSIVQLPLHAKTPRKGHDTIRIVTTGGGVSGRKTLPVVFGVGAVTRL
ncbi:MAG TPA: hypothetical protein VG652_00515 [Gaiellaceae bacterium]|nr:hypothetical protein [Gaiellaceae bacterium]